MDLSEDDFRATKLALLLSDTLDKYTPDNKADCLKWIAEGADMHGTHYQPGTDIIIKATRVGDVDIIRALLNAGADVHSRNNASYRTALMETVMRGQHEAADILLQHDASIVHDRDQDGCTPLHLAMIGGDDVFVEKLLKAGADPESKKSYGQPDTPLLHAIKTAISPGDIQKSIVHLQNAGADIDARHELTERTALMQATYVCNRRAAEGLIVTGADVNAENSLGLTIAENMLVEEHMGVRAHNLEWQKEILRLLLETGKTDFFRKNSYGMTLQDMIADAGNRADRPFAQVAKQYLATTIEKKIATGTQQKRKIHRKGPTP
ncbi:MAG: ankyrin repeat domain-containing protein [Alphaproteobacteria bacterium]|nr:ankyrin repeat domain-containing protein [Alphaproteobacteria bacterium]